MDIYQKTKRQTSAPRSTFFGEFQRELEKRGIEVTPSLHHASKYHDPSSEFYIGVECVNCE